MFPSDTAGWIGFSLALAVIIPMAIICGALCWDNTRALNQDKDLRARLKQLQIDVAETDPDDAEAVSQIQARTTALGHEIDEFQRSPWVIAAPVTYGRVE